MVTQQSDSYTKKNMDQESICKKPYSKPTLTRYGSVESLTKGVAGSGFDCSTPGVKPPDTTCEE